MSTLTLRMYFTLAFQWRTNLSVRLLATLNIIADVQDKANYRGPTYHNRAHLNSRHNRPFHHTHPKSKHSYRCSRCIHRIDSLFSESKVRWREWVEWYLK